MAVLRIPGKCIFWKSPKLTFKEKAENVFWREKEKVETFKNAFFTVFAFWKSAENAFLKVSTFS
jgi:hypothetical protein